MDRRSVDEVKEQGQHGIASISAAVILLLLIVFIFVPTAYAEDTDGVMPDNGIPVVTVTIDEKAEGYGTIDEMNESADHSVKCHGTVKIDVPKGFHYSDYPDSKCESIGDSIMEIRGRGNTTWDDNKKPYKIKLKNKASMLGFGKNKHWVLIANAYDRTLIKDRMTGWLGDAIGMEFTPRGVPVDLVMKNTEGKKNKKLGSYLFCSFSKLCYQCWGEVLLCLCHSLSGGACWFACVNYIKLKWNGEWTRCDFPIGFLNHAAVYDSCRVKAAGGAVYYILAPYYRFKHSFRCNPVSCDHAEPCKGCRCHSGGASHARSDGEGGGELHCHPRWQVEAAPELFHCLFQKLICHRRLRLFV